MPDEKTMIKEIKVAGWPEIEKAVAALPDEKLAKYQELKKQFEEETAKPHPNHEAISSLIREANSMLTPLPLQVL